MFGRKKPKEVKRGFTYFKGRDFNESNLGKYGLPRQYLPPASNFAGSAGMPVLRSMEVLKPAVAMQGNTVVYNDPRGLAGNGPVHNSTSTGPLVDLSSVNYSNPAPIG